LGASLVGRPAVKQVAQLGPLSPTGEGFVYTGSSESFFMYLKEVSTA